MAVIRTCPHYPMRNSLPSLYALCCDTLLKMGGHVLCRCDRKAAEMVHDFCI